MYPEEGLLTPLTDFSNNNKKLAQDQIFTSANQKPEHQVFPIILSMVKM